LLLVDGPLLKLCCWLMALCCWLMTILDVGRLLQCNLLRIYPSSIMFSMSIKFSFQRPIFDLHDSVFVFIVLIEYSWSTGNLMSNTNQSYNPI
jgi:hypothetical protein